MCSVCVVKDENLFVNTGAVCATNAIESAVAFRHIRKSVYVPICPSEKYKLTIIWCSIHPRM